MILTGGIPDSLGEIAGLNSLDLRGNQLTRGKSPPGFLECVICSFWTWAIINLLAPSRPVLGANPILRTLYLFNNDLSGSIPAELGNLRELTDVSLGGNRLSGSLPAALGRAPRAGRSSFLTTTT